MARTNGWRQYHTPPPKDHNDKSEPGSNKRKEQPQRIPSDTIVEAKPKKSRGGGTATKRRNSESTQQSKLSKRAAAGDQIVELKASLQKERERNQRLEQELKSSAAVDRQRLNDSASASEAAVEKAEAAAARAAAAAELAEEVVAIDRPKKRMPQIIGEERTMARPQRSATEREREQEIADARTFALLGDISSPVQENSLSFGSDKTGSVGDLSTNSKLSVKSLPLGDAMKSSKTDHATSGGIPELFGGGAATIASASNLASVKATDAKDVSAPLAVTFGAGAIGQQTAKAPALYGDSDNNGASNKSADTRALFGNKNTSGIGATAAAEAQKPAGVTASLGGLFGNTKDDTTTPLSGAESLLGGGVLP